MVNKCDICGSKLEPDAQFCNGCGVDLKEPDAADNVNVNTKKPQPAKKNTEPSSKQETPDNEKVIKWCVIQSWCNTARMSFSRFFNLVVILASGEMKLGFCDCSACNEGYREMLAMVADTTGKKKVTAQSREIVIKARGRKIDGFALDISEFLRMIKEKEESDYGYEDETPKPQRPTTGKIMIEIDPVVLENAVFAVLKSERGQEAIRSVPKKNAKTKGRTR